MFKPETIQTLNLPPSTETGRLNIMHLKRFWNKSMLTRSGAIKGEDFHDEWKTDTTLLHALGLGLEQTMQYLYVTAPSFEQFEDWIIEVTGGRNADKIEQFNQLLAREDQVAQAGEFKYELLTQRDLDFWDENGYIIIKQAVSKENCDIAIQVLCDFIGIERYNPDTWYRDHSAKQGIMVQLFQHPVLDENRKSPRVKKAFEEIWKRTDIWVNTDRVGFNPPETESHKFKGPRLHWDASIKQPMPFGTQGILYLSDTAENQGAFTLVPGFQNKIADWMDSLPVGSNPRTQDLYALGPMPIAANAGDLIIWHQALPHGSSPNTSKLPRFVQYVNYAPFDEVVSDVWV